MEKKDHASKTMISTIMVAIFLYTIEALLYWVGMLRRKKGGKETDSLDVDQGKSVQEAFFGGQFYFSENKKDVSLLKKKWKKIS